MPIPEKPGQMKKWWQIWKNRNSVTDDPKVKSNISKNFNQVEKEPVYLDPKAVSHVFVMVGMDAPEPEVEGGANLGNL